MHACQHPTSGQLSSLLLGAARSPTRHLIAPVLIPTATMQLPKTTNTGGTDVELGSMHLQIDTEAVQPQQSSAAAVDSPSPRGRKISARGMAKAVASSPRAFAKGVKGALDDAADYILEVVDGQPPVDARTVVSPSNDERKEQLWQLEPACVDNCEVVGPSSSLSRSISR